ncbi:MAG: flavin reductase [Gammaproteobacteria bacterium GWE2_42_36]|nr:MAG: flavin reductase [Gammaproteobacteria bacterium GWE2_42_36]HCU05407.1 flavin reductase [Coxiellaceae bacterium]
MDKKALLKIQYGLYIVTSLRDDQLNGQIASVVFQVTCDPPKIATCLSKNTLTHEYVQSSGVFGVSLLEKETSMPFIGRFGFRSGRDINKFENIHYEIGLTGCPLVIDNALTTLEVKVTQSVDVGTHTLYVGELISAKELKVGEALTYEYYHTFKKGKSPKNAPTYQECSCS